MNGAVPRQQRRNRHGQFGHQKQSKDSQQEMDSV
jgi:hypothetical protein